MGMSDLQLELRELYDRLGNILGMLDGGGRAPAAPRHPVESAAGGRFDYSNRAHRIAAEEIFDRMGISDKRRSWFYNNRLHGIRVAELEAVIREADAEYRRRYPPRQQAGGGRSWRR